MNDMLKAVIENNGKRAYFDLCTDKGYNAIIHALKRINYKGNEYYLVTAGETNLRFTKVSEKFNIIVELVQPSTYLADIFIACKILSKDDKDFISHIDEKYKSNKIKSISDIEFFDNLYYAKKLLQEHPIALSDPNIIAYEQIKIFGKKALFTPHRIDKSKVPKKVYVYEAMADDDQNGEIVTLGKNIHVNFWGTILTTNKISLDKGYHDVNEERDIVFSDKPSIHLNEFLERNPPNKNKEYSR